MTTRIKLYITAAAIILTAASGYSLWSYIQLSRLETVVEGLKQTAAEKQEHAAELESRSRVYEGKIAYLESNLDELKTLAMKQDDELKQIDITTGNARADVERTRRIRSAAATADEVCRKLAELGHPCE